LRFRAPRTALVLGAAIALFGCASSAQSAPTSAITGSGITGRVLLGPTCPVQRPGQSCVRPYQTSVAVFTRAGHRLKTFRSGRDGRFRVGLRPGHYTLKATRGGLPRLTPTPVTVRPGHFTRVTLMFDTGIR
jgi:hypothetical protein